ncbi:MAG: DNA-3-methyladenine glycosylase I [Proteobacteria bacterium]|nr:DNA-3-methyladenine glycosylase I [Pseudomonadota bacterium]
MISFDEFQSRALARHGEDNLEARFPTVLPADELRKVTDDRCLAAMSKRVFAAGFRWAVIRAKWDTFEEAFEGFDPHIVAAYGESEIDSLAQDKRIVRNRPKIVSTINNARFVVQTADEHGSFASWLADWPATDTIGLWAAMKQGGDRLGGDTGAWFLRLIGRDTFRLSGDVVACLIEAGVVEKKPTGKRDLAATQEAFNQWAEESGMPMSHISVVLACSAGEVYER